MSSSPLQRVLFGILVLSSFACSRSLAKAEDVNQRELFARAEKFSSAENWPEAIHAWEQVTAVNPQFGEAWSNLATAYYRGKEYRKAIAACARLQELRTSYPFNAPYRIACCHALLGEKEAALQWLQKALDRGFRRLNQIRNDNDLRSLREDPRFLKMVGSVDVAKLTREEGWRFDIDLLVREVKRCHYAPFRKVTAAEFDTAVSKLRNDVPKLSDDQLVVGLQKLLHLVGDGHTSLSRNSLSASRRDRVPAVFYFFTEGLFITHVDPRFPELVGCKVVRINGRSIEDVLKALDEVVSQDNSQGLLWLAPNFLRMPRILNGLGLLADNGLLPLTIVDAGGKQRDVVLPADAGDPEKNWITARQKDAGSEPLFLKHADTAYWFEHIPAEKMVFFRFNAVTNQGSETFEAFCTRLFQFINDHEVERLVIDLRGNGGGNNFLNQPLIHGLIRCDKVNQDGKLFVVVGRNTFSAAMCCATDIERHTRAIFVGEPTGSSPNFVGESAVIVELPYSKLRASISDLYWQNSVAMDFRTWIAPSIFAPPTFSAYRSNRDVALEAIHACTKTEAGNKSLGEKKQSAGNSKAQRTTAYTISTVAGNGTVGFAGDGGQAVKASLNKPCAVAVDGAGQLYIADYSNHRIRKVSKEGVISTLAGTGVAGFAGDGGPAVEAQLNGPYGVAVDSKGNVYIADQRNNRIRKVAPDGIVSTLAGTGRREFSGDGGPANKAGLAGADAVVADNQGNLFIADTGNHRIRKVSADGTINTVAGSTQGYAGNGGPALEARLNCPAALALDVNGNMYIGDFRNHVVRKITPQGIITTVAGADKRGFNGDHQPATKTQLNEPGGVGVLPDGSVVIADGLNFRVRRVDSAGVISTIAGTGKRGFSGDGGPAQQADLSVLDILAVDSHGNIYLTDHGVSRIRKLTPVMK